MKVECPHCHVALNVKPDSNLAKTRCPACKKYLQTREFVKQGVEVSPSAKAKEMSSLPAGYLIGKYKIEKIIGRGGMGVVYRAIQEDLKRPVALKALAMNFADDLGFVARFEREAGVMATLNHENIAQVYERGEQDNICYFAMEFVEGTNLRAILQKGRPPLDFTFAIFSQIAAALEYSHSRDVVHRDIKPENILLTPEYKVKVVDFGIARLNDSQQNEQLTLTNTAMGTMHYMAPEQQIDARNVDHRADIYSLGVILYEMLTGALPMGQFEMPSQMNPAVPPAMDEVIKKALASRAENRIQTCRDLAEATAQALGFELSQGMGGVTRITRPSTNTPHVTSVGTPTPPTIIKEHDYRQDRRRHSNAGVWVLLLLLAGGAGGYFYYNNLMDKAKPEEAEPAKPQVKKKKINLVKKVVNKQTLSEKQTKMIARHRSEAQRLIDADRLGDAIKEYEKAHAISKSPEDMQNITELKSREAMWKADRLYAEGEYAQALSLYQAAYRVNPRSEKAVRRITEIPYRLYKGLANNAWPSTFGDYGCSSRSSRKLNLRKNLHWIGRSLPGSITGSMILADEWTVLAYSEGVYYPFDIANGEKKNWSIRADDKRMLPLCVGAGIESVIYMPFAKGFRVHSGVDGSKIWEWIVPGDKGPTAPLSISRSGSVLIPCDKSLYAVNANSQKQEWVFSADESIVTAPAQTLSGEILFGTKDGQVYSINSENGKALWNFKGIKSAINGISIDSLGRAYISAADSKLHAMNALNGKKLWEANTEGLVPYPPVISSAGLLYVISESGIIMEVSEKGGVTWRRNLGVKISAPPVIDESGVLIFGTLSGEIYGFNSKHEQVYGIIIGKKITGSPLITRSGMILVAVEQNIQAYGTP